MTVISESRLRHLHALERHVTVLHAALEAVSEQETIIEQTETELEERLTPGTSAFADAMLARRNAIQASHAARQHLLEVYRTHPVEVTP